VVLVGVEESETYGKNYSYRRAEERGPQGRPRGTQLWRSTPPDRTIDLDRPDLYDGADERAATHSMTNPA
jgi:hypothetical protein